MKSQEETWGWMLAVDFFCAGMGGAVLFITSTAIWLGQGDQVPVAANILGPLLITLGALFLIFELGRPLQAWRVFVRPAAILTLGAWHMAIAIVGGLGLAMFNVGWGPWPTSILLENILIVVCAWTGLVVAFYPGLLLATQRARPFWSGPGMISLFLISSLVTASSALLLLGHASNFRVDDFPFNMLHGVALFLLGFQGVLWIGYLWAKVGGAQAEEKAARVWLDGELALLFWGGVIGLGTLVPMLFLMTPSLILQRISPALVLGGGLLMRVMVVRSGRERTWLPGEKDYLAGLPQGDEEFIKT